eukprot:Gb_30989 [translate_table: standard]
MDNNFSIYRPSANKFTLQSKRYHVFLSFRGPDVRKTLVDHLFESLTAAGVHVFLDNERLEKGENIEFSLRQAVEDTEIHIPIFSPDYAESYWCLEEVTQMSKSKGLLIPLFYDVEPSDVRYPRKGRYAKAFEQHYSKGRYSTDTIAAWEKALFEVSSRSGWSLRETTFGYQAKLVKRVVLDVLETLNSVSLEVAKFAVGLKERMDNVISLLKIDNNLDQRVIIVGIWGMGGIGKTTLTKAVFNKIHLGFEAFCFVSDVRTGDLKELQMQVLKDLLKVKLDVNNIDHGKSLLRARLGCVRALLILDDVDDIKQLEALGIDWLGPNSRVIVTTRDQQILKTKGNAEIYKMEGLSGKHALELFCWHAFMRASPNKIYEDLSIQIVNACGGLPLSLEVLGSYLYNVEDNRYWNETLTRLKSGMFQNISESLQISYNALNYEEKQIFLDIACFFIGEEREISISFWEASKWSVLSSIMNLQLRSLIKLTNDDRFMMHDQLRDMGRAIVAEESHENPGKRSRLWHPDDVNQVIDQRRGTYHVRGLVRSHREKEELIWQTDSFASMSSLQLLVAQKAIIKGDMGMLSPNLKWLQLEKCDLECLPSVLNMQSLSILHLKWGHFKELWNENTHFKTPRNLKVLKLEGCRNLQRLPNLSNLASLTRLKLKSCPDLKKIPASIGLLRKLKHLEIYYCKLLQKLPQSITKLSSLEKLSLFLSTGITKLPKSLGNLRALKELKLGYLQINELPHSLGSLACLEKLDLSYCGSLTSLPTTICALKRLCRLDLRFCPCLSSLPEDFGNLESLETLLMSGCNLFELPHSFGNLGSLRILKMSSNVNLISLPKTFGNLVNLREIVMDTNSSLKKLPSSFSELGSLVHLEAYACNLVTGGLPEEIGDLPSLRVLHLQFNAFSTLPESFTHLSQLTELLLHHCPELCELPTLPGGLLKVDIGDCPQLRKVSDISSLKKLEALVLCNCEQIRDLPGLESLQSLRELNLSQCKNLQKKVFIDLKGLKSLQALHLNGCPISDSEADLHELIKELHCLQQLSLSANGIAQSLEWNLMKPKSSWIEFGPNIVYVDATIPMDMNAKCRGVIFCFLLKFERPQSTAALETDVHCGQIIIERDGEEIFNTKVFSNRQAVFKNQLYLYIYRENHPLTMRLQGGDLVCVSPAALDLDNPDEQRAIIKKSRMQLLYGGAEECPMNGNEALILEKLGRELNELVQNYNDDEEEEDLDVNEDGNNNYMEDDESEDESDEDDESDNEDSRLLKRSRKE